MRRSTCIAKSYSMECIDERHGAPACVRELRGQAAMSFMVRLELRDGTVKWRKFADTDYATDHSTLCRAFGLDPVRTTFDLPSTARGVGSASGDHHGKRGIINGYVLWPTANALGPKDREPIGTITFVQEGEKIPDVDPFNSGDFLNLNRRLG